MEQFGDFEQKDNSAEKARKINGIKAALKVLSLAALTLMPMKAMAGNGDDFKIPEDKPEAYSLQLKNVKLQDVDEGTKLMKTAVEAEMHKQGFSQAEIDSTLSAPAQEDNKLLAAE